MRIYLHAIGIVTVMVAVALLTGCANTAVPYWTDLKACRRDMLGYAMIPDFGITHEQKLRKCMRDEGWTEIPYNHLNPEERLGWAIPGYRKVPPGEPPR